MKRSWAMGCAFAALFLTGFGFSGHALGAETENSALLKQPARNAALIAKVPGFKSADEKLYLGDRKVTEGVMIRKSEIRDGKIVIPPAGLVYSSRLANIGPMTGLEIMLLGKLYPEVDEESELLVLKDRKMKKGDSVNLLPDGSRALQFVSGSRGPYGIRSADSANFRIMKSTGNYYGANFTVATADTLKDVNSGEFKGLGLPEGRHSLGAMAPDALQHQTFVGNSIYPSGNSYLIAGNVNANEAEVKEFATPMLNRVWLASNPRISGAYGPGETVQVGDSSLHIDAVTPDSVILTLTDPSGRSRIKKFDGLSNPDALKYLPTVASERAKYQMGSGDDDIRVQLAMLHPEGVITPDGKVRLDIYSGVFSFGNPETWKGDAKFTIRPDT